MDIFAIAQLSCLGLTPQLELVTWF